MELHIIIIVFVSAVTGCIGLVVGYWWKGVEIKEAEHREDLRLATDNTIDGECLGDFPNVPRIIVDNTK